jgi:hypothetical protein
MNKTWFIVIAFVIILTACAKATPTVTEIVTETASQTTIDPFPLPVERGQYFATSGVCTSCHRNMVDINGQDVSIDTFWRGTMMANASRDPYWRASVRAEVIRNPDYDEIIQDKCTTCHMPMARTTQVFAGGKGVLLDDGFANPENPLHILALDGISCTLCHQIDPQGLGEEDSFDGAFTIDNTKPTGERTTYGPFEVSDENVILMRSASGYIPSFSEHIQTSEICASCHTLVTPTVDNQGEIAGEFPEQMPYIEWLASSYAEDKTCQDCHMPVVQGNVVLSTTGSQARGQFSQHSFAGGNIYSLTLLQTHGEEIGVTASRDQITAALDRAIEQLHGQTAEVKLNDLAIAGDTLSLMVEIKSQVGHKFPSGFPSRRVWVHLVVKDAAGNRVFESGGYTENGQIEGNDNDSDGTLFEPHYQVIESPEQVQIYETIMGDVDGAVTTTLLRGAAYLKDNRLLPDGFEKESVDEKIAVCGNANSDADFLGGSDGVEYRVDLAGAQGPFTVTAELLYQSIGYRWAQNLAGFEAPEPQLFITYYDSVPNLPVVVSSTTVEFDR